jgi:protein-S-isoprenylcysteine O-methyltransferase Ste14
LLIWVLAARHVKATRWREPPMSRMVHRIPLALAIFLLSTKRGLPSILTERLLPPSPALGIVGIALVATGLAFAVWARWYLGTNWSSVVTLKEGHALVRTGPYRYVRHPIYSGLLLAVCGSAAVVGAGRGILALGLTIFALVYKSRVEEARMRDTFSEYDAYCRETAALIPFIF